jgi:hypothetical protein
MPKEQEDSGRIVAKMTSALGCCRTRQNSRPGVKPVPLARYVGWARGEKREPVGCAYSTPGNPENEKLRNYDNFFKDAYTQVRISAGIRSNVTSQPG